ncbi:hypothetical protein EJ08DRAFT_628691 [Tothia fuscella]|uniref:S-adenosyl-L-methionine-dependent methyltransferase n=1 Tax=Tothia fuscella TaxID=1048955 RepID=A0A9P4NXF9_9PEZI|nr:hypothetical protein EJ08DRAFT_628691 [Tothia fuscella]
MTESATPTYLETIEIHGRDFQKHSIENGVYYVPVDEGECEEDRLSLQHKTLYHVFGDKLFLPPLEYPRRILDCGYGPGDWAVDMATTYSHSEVIAMDIYPGYDLPSEPENLERHAWNLNDQLVPTYERDSFDLIHSRCVGPGIKTDRWAGYLRDLRRLLARGGYLQVAEFNYNIQSHSGLLTNNHDLQKWSQAYTSAMRGLDRNPNIGGHLEAKLREAGLSDVAGRCFQIPIGIWPTDPRQRKIGEWNQNNMNSMLDSHALWPITTRLGWTRQQVGWLTEGAKQEMHHANLRLYIRLYVAWGKKR